MGISLRSALDLPPLEHSMILCYNYYYIKGRFYFDIYIKHEMWQLLLSLTGSLLYILGQGDRFEG